MSILGNRVLRMEDERMLTTGGRYVGDLAPAGAAHVTFVRSTVAHGRISSIDTTRASTMPGVLGVFTSADLHLDGRPLDDLAPPFAGIDEAMTRPLLARDRVRFVGEAVAAVVAETPGRGLDAAERVIVDVEPLEPVVTVADAAGDGHLLFPEAGTNLAFSISARSEVDFDDCEVVIDRRFVNQRLAPAPIEPRVATASWESGRLIHHASSQGSHPVRDALCSLYHLDPADVRVITPDVGGGFGAKGSPSPEELLMGALSRAVDRPVTWSETRSENLVAMTHGRAQHQRIRLGGSRDGRLTHYRLDVEQDCGGYPSIGAVIPVFTRIVTPGVYDLEQCAFAAECRVTNSTPVGAYRGAGRPEAAAALERAVDMFAVEIGMDPVELRRRNLIASDAFPHRTPVGTTYDSGDYEAALDKVLEAADYEALRAEQSRRRAAADPVELGIGVAVYVEVTGGRGGTEHGSVELTDSGGAVVRTGSTPYGQGHATTWAMLAGARTGIALEQVTVLHGDTDEIPEGGVTGGSRSTQIAGTAVYQAAGALIEEARHRAADLLEAAVADVVHDPDGGGRFHVVGAPSRSVGWADVAAAAAQTLVGVADGAQSDGSYPFGAHLAVVEVDTETGAVTVLRMVACDDAGTLVNPLLAEGQIHGGLAQGVAQALMEEVRYDGSGNPLTTNFADYAVVSATELPSFERIEMQTPSPLNELGAKGIGESGTIGSTPAVHNAVCDALVPLGIDHIDMPCTPMRVWEAIREARL